MNWWLFGVAMVLFIPTVLSVVLVVAGVLVHAWLKWPEMMLFGLVIASLCGGAVAMSYAVPQ